jgi:hypothetical protein
MDLLSFDDRRALELRGDRDYGNSHYLEDTMRIVAEAKETLPTLGRIYQGKNGVNELGLGGYLESKSRVCHHMYNKQMHQANLHAGICSIPFQLARYGRGQCKTMLSYRAV